jgi:ArsR family transcriptional regulator, cadmium/lead-responsive transcriptional repressor
MFVRTEAQETAIKARLFRGLSDSSRLAILEALRNGPQTVSEIVSNTGLSQSNTSNHLSCLSDCGLVSRSQKGRNVIYQLSDPRVEALLVLAEQLLSDAARGVYECTRYHEREAV